MSTKFFSTPLSGAILGGLLGVTPAIGSYYQDVRIHREYPERGGEAPAINLAEIAIFVPLFSAAGYFINANRPAIRKDGDPSCGQN